MFKLIKLVLLTTGGSCGGIVGHFLAIVCNCSRLVVQMHSLSCHQSAIFFTTITMDVLVNPRNVGIDTSVESGQFVLGTANAGRHDAHYRIPARSAILYQHWTSTVALFVKVNHLVS